MKIRLLPVFTIVLFLFTSCSKKEDCDNAIYCLPAMTQTGANTAGCLVDGKVFFPGGQGINTGSVLRALYNSSDDDSLFGLSITNNNSGNRMVFIEIRNQILIEGSTYELKGEDSPIFGGYFNGIKGYTTSDDHRGELTISKIDTDRQIVSGTFSFDAINSEGEIVVIRNGRFDVLYYAPQ